MSEENKDEDTKAITPVWQYPEFKALSDHTKEIEILHLRDLLSAEKNKDYNKRNASLTTKFDGITLDCTRQKATSETVSKLITLAKAAKLTDKINEMFTGVKINRTEDRSVLHIALRSKPTDKIMVNGINVVESVHKVLNKIKIFSNKVRSGEWKGYSNKPITNVISIGIGGSYLGAEFVFQALKTDPIACKNATGRQLRFYANIDPIGFSRAIMDLDPETTLCIVVSKSFTTRETMMNASFIREWLVNAYKGDEKCLTSHFIAVSANPTLPTKKFGVDANNIFEFWDWVGGRYSVCSAVGILPLSLHYGYDIMEEFLKGCNSIDEHFKTAEFSCNIPILMGLFGIWNTTFLKYNCRGLIPYCEALNRLPAHIQQLDMESNGKRIDLNGNLSLFNNCSGEIDLGEPGTNAQHSFFQLIHQGRVIPVDFIGFCKSQLVENDMYQNNKKFIDIINNNHNELMSNFFAQCDALALGKTRMEVKKELVESKTMDEKKMNYIIPHKVFAGNRPSSLLLFDGYLNAYKTGQILSIFEHRTVVQGFIWNIGSFDQWGVQLGKVLGKSIRKQIDDCINDKEKGSDKSKYFKQFTPNTQTILQYYCEKSQ